MRSYGMIDQIFPWSLDTFQGAYFTHYLCKSLPFSHPRFLRACFLTTFRWCRLTHQRNSWHCLVLYILYWTVKCKISLYFHLKYIFLFLYLYFIISSYVPFLYWFLNFRRESKKLLYISRSRILQNIWHLVSQLHVCWMTFKSSCVHIENKRKWRHYVLCSLWSDTEGPT